MTTSKEVNQRELRPRKEKKHSCSWDHHLVRLQQNDPSLKSFDATQLNENGLRTLKKAVLANTHLERLFVTPPALIGSAKGLAKTIRTSRITCLSLWVFHAEPKTAHVMQILYLEGIKRSNTIQELEIAAHVGDVNALLEILPRLRTLRLSNIRNWERCNGLLEELASSSLRELHVSHQRLPDNFFRVISSSSSIETLKLHCCTPSVDFSEEWSPESRLKELIVSCRLWPDQVLELLHAAASQRALETLTLDGNNSYDDAVLESIAEGLAADTVAIKHLALTRVWDEDAEDTQGMSQLFLKAVQTNTHLHTLDLSGNEFKLDGDEETFRRSIEYYTTRNRVRPFLEREQFVPLGVWCHVMAHYKHNPSCIYHVVQQQPTLVTFLYQTEFDM